MLRVSIVSLHGAMDDAVQWQRWREDAGLDQDGAAKKLGISRVTLSRYENGRSKIPDDMREKMIGLYGVTRETSPLPPTKDTLRLGIAIGMAQSVQRQIEHALEEQRRLILHLSTQAGGVNGEGGDAAGGGQSAGTKPKLPPPVPSEKLHETVRRDVAGAGKEKPRGKRASR